MHMNICIHLYVYTYVLRAAKKLSSEKISVSTPLEGSSDDGISKVLNQPLSIHLNPAGTALINSPLD